MASKEGELVFNKTKKRTEIEIREGQQKFRSDVISEIDYCPITSINDKHLLIASHIKPWSRCDNYEDKVNPKNGLLLSPLFDKLFDRGFISFSPV